MLRSISMMILSLVAVLAVTGCSKGSSSDSDATAVTTLGYTLSNGYCYNSANQVVDGNYCSNISNYYSVNGYCYNPQGGIVDQGYCGNGNQALILPPRRCEGGQYYMPRNGRRAPMDCRGGRCRGNLVFDGNGHAFNCR